MIHANQFQKRTGEARKQFGACRPFRVFCWRIQMALAAIAACAACMSHAEDWPTYRHDVHRSGVSAENLDPKTLAEAWRFASPQPPQPAWHGPAKWDAFAGIRGLRSMRDYDPVFHAIAAGDSIYFGSSAEDCVYCLDAKTGERQWVFFTDGPVRLAPTFDSGLVYFGSDDGNAYCVKADTGELVWKFRPSPAERLIPNDGKLIPLWPCRTGVLVDSGKAYFGANLLPWHETYLCAVDAATGSPEGPGLYVRTFTGITMEGPLLASPSRLYAPQGRSAPLLFDRATGEHLGTFEGGGGVFAVLTPDLEFAHGPGNKAGWITLSDAETRDKVASFDAGNCMVVGQEEAYVLKDTALVCVNRKSGEERWTSVSDCPYMLIMSGTTLFAGGNDRVAAHAVETGEKVAELRVAGRAYGLAVSDGQLFVSTDTGTIHCFH